MEYSIVIHNAGEGGYWSEVPALPGCYSQGKSLQETLDNTREAVELYVEELLGDGKTVPRDDQVVYKISVAPWVPKCLTFS